MGHTEWTGRSHQCPFLKLPALPLNFESLFPRQKSTLQGASLHQSCGRKDGRTCTPCPWSHPRLQEGHRDQGAGCGMRRTGKLPSEDRGPGQARGLDPLHLTLPPASSPVRDTKVLMVHFPTISSSCPAPRTAPTGPDRHLNAVRCHHLFWVTGQTA